MYLGEFTTLGPLDWLFVCKVVAVAGAALVIGIVWAAVFQNRRK